jgi:hypothetical protein
VWRPGDGDEAAVEEKLNGSSDQARWEGKNRRGRCGEERRGSPPFIGVGGWHEEAAVGRQWSMFKRINAIDGRGFKEWFKRGNQGEGVKGLSRHLMVQSLVARGGRKRHEGEVVRLARAALGERG